MNKFRVLPSSIQEIFSGGLEIENLKHLLTKYLPYPPKCFTFQLLGTGTSKSLNPNAVYVHLKVKVFSVADQVCLSRIPDPSFFSIPDPHPKNLSIFTQKIVISSRKNYPGCSSRIRIFYPSRIRGSKRPRIPDPDSQH